MKIYSSNSCFLNKFNTLLGLIVLCLFLFTSCKCKRCEGFDSKTEMYISANTKTSVLGFPTGTNWIFERVSTGARDSSIRDTIVLGAQEIYPLEKGDCAVKDKGQCCSDYYYQKSNRNLVVHSASGLNNFRNYYTDAEGLGMKGDWGKIFIINNSYSQNFTSQLNRSITLAISNKVITDTKSAEQYYNDSSPFLVCWSKQYGLVKYAYKTATDTLEYERVNLLP
jgi:hypothetical protein